MASPKQTNNQSDRDTSAAVTTGTDNLISLQVQEDTSSEAALSTVGGLQGLSTDDTQGSTSDDTTGMALDSIAVIVVAIAAGSVGTSDVSPIAESTGSTSSSENAASDDDVELDTSTQQSTATSSDREGTTPVDSADTGVTAQVSTIDAEQAYIAALDIINTQSSALESRFSRIQQAIASQEEVLESKKEELDNMKLNINIMGVQITTVEAIIKMSVEAINEFNAKRQAAIDAYLLANTHFEASKDAMKVAKAELDDVSSTVEGTVLHTVENEAKCAYLTASADKHYGICTEYRTFIEETTVDLQKATDSLASHRARAGEIQESITALTNSYNKVNAEVNALNHAIAVSSEESRSVSASIVSTVGDLTMLNANHQENRSKIERLTSVTRSLSFENQNLDALYDSAQQLVNTIRSVDSDIDTINKAATDRNEAMSTFQVASDEATEKATEATQMDSQIQDIQEEKRRQEAAFQEARVAHDSTVARTRDLEKQYSLLRDTMVDLEQRASTLKLSLQGAADDNLSTLQDVEGLDHQLSVLKRQHNEVVEQLKTANEANSKADSDLQFQRESLQRVTDTLQAARANVAKFLDGLTADQELAAEKVKKIDANTKVIEALEGLLGIPN